MWGGLDQNSGSHTGTPTISPRTGRTATSSRPPFTMDCSPQAPAPEPTPQPSSEDPTISRVLSPRFPEKSRAAAVLILGIAGIIGLPVFGPVAWVMGNQALTAISDGRRPPREDMARAGRALGVVATTMLLLMCAEFVLALTSLIAIY